MVTGETITKRREYEWQCPECKGKKSMTEREYKLQKRDGKNTTYCVGLDNDHHAKVKIKITTIEEVVMNDE